MRATPEFDFGLSEEAEMIRDTVERDTPDSHPNARTRSSTLRVEVPVT